MKIFLFFLVFVALVLLNTAFIYAHCPLCTGAVGVAAVSAKYYGIDTSIVGLFIGAFGISTGLWIGKRIKKRYFRFQLPVIVLSSFLLTVIPLRFIGGENFFLPLFFSGEYGSIFNKVYAIDKMLFGSIIGGLASLFAFGLHDYVKKLKGKVLFPFQGIIFTLASLTITGTILFLAFNR